MIRKGKRYNRPKKLYEKSRIEEENLLLEQYGLKNKREVWKTLAKVNYFRHRAMDLARAPTEEQEALFSKLQNLGLKVSTIADVLALGIEDILKRRLATVMARKGLATTVKQARQMIVHKKVRIKGNVINVPSYLVSIDEEESITVESPKAAPKAENAEQEKEVIA